MVIDVPFETEFNGVYTCKNSSGNFTRIQENVCVLPNHVYIAKDATYTTNDVKLVCRYEKEDGGYHVHVSGTVK